jgi:hypothetical protein
MFRAALTVSIGVSATACSFAAKGADDAKVVDGSKTIDASVDAPSCGGAALLFAPTHFAKCEVSPIKISTFGVGAVVTIDTTAKTIDDGTGPRALTNTTLHAQDNGPELLLLASNNLTVPSGQIVRVVGSRALVLVDIGQLTVVGKIIAGADHATPGAGSFTAACRSEPFLQNGRNSILVSGAGGGGFGSPLSNSLLQLSGGDGGNVGLLPGSSGGTVSSQEKLTPLRGGCRGGTGNDATPGGGGGAIALVANGVTIAGVVSTPGGGGGGAQSLSGGGSGGGSGGAVFVEGNVVTVSGKITANGGGGGGGAAAAAGTDGNNGATDDASHANGGVSPNGGEGVGGSGAGGTVSASKGTNGRVTGGGMLKSTAGGGGGGPGVLRLRSITSSNIGTAFFSPAPILQ